MNNEGALIAFTLLSQLAVGATILYALFFFTRKDIISGLSSGSYLKTPELLLLSILVVAVIISFLHLGKPAHAGHALDHLQSSWLSREILFLLLFALSLFLLFLGRWLLGSRAGIQSVLFLLSAISGALLITAMARLYMIPAVVTWNTWLTPAGFVLSTLILGVCAVLAYSAAFNTGFDKSRSLFPLLIALLFAEAIVTGLNQSMLGQVMIPHDNRFLLEGVLLNVSIIRMAAIASAILLLFIVNSRMRNRKSRPPLRMLAGAIIMLVVIEQLAGRFVFYAGFVKVGL